MKELENLREAFPAMPEECRGALMNAARSVREEAPSRRKYPLAVLAAALVMLMTTVAVAEGWNVLAFLGIRPDSYANTLVQPLSLSASADNVTFTIGSAVTDGEFLAFDWTVTNADPSRPAYISIEGFTANGRGSLYNISTTDYDDQWLPGFTNPASLQGGCIAPLVGWMQEEDILHIKLTLAIHTAVNPAAFLEANHFDEALALLDQGYTVIIGNDRYGRYSDSNIPGAKGVAIPRGVGPGDSVHGTERTTLTLSFDLDMKAARATRIRPELPEPLVGEYVTLSLDAFTVSPLQIRLVAIAAWHDNAPVGSSAKFILRDKAGNTIRVKEVSASEESYTEVIGRARLGGSKETVWECSIISPTSSMPAEATLVLHLTDGTELSMPLQFR